MSHLPKANLLSPESSGPGCPLGGYCVRVFSTLEGSGTKAWQPPLPWALPTLCLDQKQVLWLSTQTPWPQTQASRARLNCPASRSCPGWMYDKARAQSRRMGRKKPRVGSVPPGGARVTGPDMARVHEPGTRPRTWVSQEASLSETAQRPGKYRAVPPYSNSHLDTMLSLHHTDIAACFLLGWTLKVGRMAFKS